MTVHFYSNTDDYVTAITASQSKSAETVRGYLDTGSGAEAGLASIWLYSPRLAVGNAPPQIRIMHEYIHTMQYFYSNGRARGNGSPRWLLEGGAKYFDGKMSEMFGYRNRFGVTAFGDNLRAVIRQGKQQCRGDLLSSHERPISTPSTTGDCASDLGFVAADYLANTYGVDKIQKTFWEAVAKTNWQAAFSTVFGLPVEQFYSDFESYRQAL